jgi:hypothetical protein
VKSPAKCRRPDGAKSEHHIGRWLGGSQGQFESIMGGPKSQPAARYLAYVLKQFQCRVSTTEVPGSLRQK